MFCTTKHTGSPPPPSLPPPAAAAVAIELKAQFVSRKCKIGPLLRELYKQYKVIIMHLY
jgi:hypothetical protein